MSSVLFVPIHLDALRLGNDQMFVGPTADFTRLPYFDGVRDVNHDTAPVSEDIVSRPFQNQNLYLKAGVHLHWALPDALTRGVAHADGTDFPEVPNRWLVIRSRPDTQGRRVEEKRWVVESDYLYPDGAGDASGSVSVPYNPKGDERRPFRFLGRSVPFGAWKKVDAAAQYLKPLTAVGYGEPSFAAFYPNSHSVFGFHDAAYVGVPPAGLRYDLLGWYGSSTLDAPAAGGGARDAGAHGDVDFLRGFVADKSAKYQRDNRLAADAASLNASLEKDAGWTIALDDVVNWYEAAQREQVKTFLASTKAACRAAGRELPSAGEFIAAVWAEKQLKVAAASGAQFPSHVLCYASLTFGETSNQSALDTALEVAVGNTGTEALSAFLAHAIDDKHKSVVEDQLEALHLSPQLEHRQLDIGFKFEEARHEKGFTAVSGGSLWTVAEETPDAPANASESEAVQEITLPPRIAGQLNALNVLQQQYDHSRQEIQAARKQLFSDWYKYMLSAYPPEDSKDDYPDIDEVKHYIETKGIAPLLRAVAATGELLLQGDGTGTITDARASAPASAPLASALAAAVKDLVRTLDFDANPNLKDVLKYKITNAALKALKAAGLPDAVAQSLGGLKGEAPKGKEDFLRLVAARIGDAQTASFKQQIMKAARAAVYTLKLRPGPRFWQPNEPVVLLSGLAAEPSDRHGLDGQSRDDGLLVCHVLPDADLKDLVPSNLSTVTGMLERIRGAGGADGFAFNEWKQNPWNPLLLEWEVEVFPVGSGNNLHPRSGGYAKDFITGNYALGENEVDFAYKPGKGGVMKAVNVYTGSSIMTPHAGLKFERELEKFFIKFMEPAMLAQFYGEQQVAASDRNEAYLLQHFPQLFTWYLSRCDTLLQFYKESGRTLGAGGNESWLRGNMSGYMKWSLDRVGVKKMFYDARQTPAAERNDAYLSAHAAEFVAWLKPQLHNPAHFYRETNVPAGQQNDAYLQQHVGQLIVWYQTEIQSDMQMVVMVMAYTKLAASNYLSQSLGGFNDALLMHRHTMQLAVSDPLGFEDYQAFTSRVREAVGNAATGAPRPLDDFNPVLSGAMRLNKLRLVDTFGQVLDVSCERVTTPNLMTTPAGNHLLPLSPRLVQPSRLNFRWLSAARGDEEMNDHPATTPVCGWVLPNNLDNSLMVYDNRGRALGSVGPLAVSPFVGWRTAPGETVVTTGDIRNADLQKMVKHLVAQGRDFLNDFISAIDSALENIEPENFAQHQDLALLVGRPLALVRASLDLQLQGAPALNQSWEYFRLDLERNHRQTDRFTRVRFPVRVGEYRQLNDGVVGYWKEAGDAYEGGVFYAPQSNHVGSEKIKTHADVQTGEDSPVAVFLSADAPPQTIAMLLDPRGDAHATSGIVPTKAINIPPGQYAAALRAIQVTFLATPVLTDVGKINLPLPTELGYRWEWLQKDGERWSEVSTIGATSARAEFTGPQELREGWLKLIKAEEPSDSNA